MIDFYYWPTPNGWKVSIMLEETGLPFTLRPVNIGAGDQFRPEFLKISPNARMPAIVDHDTPDGGMPDGSIPDATTPAGSIPDGAIPDGARPGGARPNGATPGGSMPVFESGAILVHLAEKAGRFMPTSRRGRKECLEWLFWQVGNLGPMAGQLSHFVNYAKSVQAGDHGYAHKRYAGEYNRCLGVLETRLEGREYILNEYSIADIICWPWVFISKPLGQPLDDFPNVSRWRNAIKARPAVQRGVDLGKDLRRQGEHTEEARKILFGQTAQSLRGTAA